MSQILSIARPDSVRSVRLDTARGTFAAFTAAPPDGVPRGTALLVPGFNGSKEDFLPLLPGLAEAGYRVVAIDQRGQYETGPASEAPSYAPEDLASDVIALAAVLGGPVRLVGHSYGGLVSRLAVLNSPSPAITWASLTLLNFGPAAVSEPTRGRLELLLDALRTTPVPQLWPFLRPEDGGVPEEVLTFLSDRWSRNAPEALRLAAERMLTEPDRSAALRACGVPASVVFGTPEETWPEREAAAMARELGARYTEIMGGGHSPNVYEPAAVIEALTGFWDSLT
ncbi:alpha/beta fold hydrolase [Streptomyces sp. NPDC058459]|uniref:alpha/beta fold hydrolase n=1 Tax=Streptomyces sp. NPDC058459 TaxID=3346508 RepID=UPI00365C83D3